MRSPLKLSRSQILRFRRSTGALEQRLPLSHDSLRRAAWAGLQDSVPRAALLSLHARVERIASSHWEDPSLVQLWGPRFNVYVVAAADLSTFSLGRLPLDPPRLSRAQKTADRIQAVLKGRRISLRQAGLAMGVPHNSLRYAAPTGTLLMRWEGSRQPLIWTVPPSGVDPQQARLELARRYLHLFGPTTDASFTKWAGIKPAEAKAAFTALAPELTPARTPTGYAWILANDEAAIRSPDSPDAGARLLPSGDAYYLLWGADRELLVPDPKRRAVLWTSRVWPGAVLVRGEIVGVWRRFAAEVSIELWRRLSAADRNAVEAEATSLPLPALDGPITIQWG